VALPFSSLDSFILCRLSVSLPPLVATTSFAVSLIAPIGN
jgi:hypothetical protein